MKTIRRISNNGRFVLAIALFLMASTGLTARASDWYLYSSTNFWTVPSDSYYNSPGGCPQWGFDVGGTGDFSTTFDNHSVTTKTADAPGVGVYATCHVYPGDYSNWVQSVAYSYAQGVWKWNGVPGSQPAAWVTNVVYLTGSMPTFTGDVNGNSGELAHSWAEGIVRGYAYDTSAANYGALTNYAEVFLDDTAVGGIFTKHATYTSAYPDPTYDVDYYSSLIDSYTIALTNNYVKSSSTTATITAATYIELDALALSHVDDGGQCAGLAEAEAGGSASPINATGVAYVKFVAE